MDKITVTFNNKTIIVGETDEEDLVEIELFENPIRINVDKIVEISELLTRSELGLLFKMTPLTKTELNMLYNGTRPHTLTTLQKYLGFSNRGRFGALLIKLDELNIVKKVSSKKNKSGRVNFIMNPNLSSRRKTYDPILEEYFVDFFMEAGNLSYKRYINSTVWKKTRLRIIADRGGKCERCDNIKSLQVHHLTYENMGNELDTDLEVLCRTCHNKEHGRKF